MGWARGTGKRCPRRAWRSCTQYAIGVRTEGGIEEKRGIVRRTRNCGGQRRAASCGQKRREEHRREQQRSRGAEEQRSGGAGASACACACACVGPTCSWTWI